MNSPPRLADLPLAELRLALAPAIADAAAFDGWSMAAVKSAAAAHGMSEELAQLAFAGDGKNPAMVMMSAWAAHIDAAMSAALPPEKLATMPVRERIRELVRFRLNAAKGREEAVSRAMSVMAMPGNVAQAAKLGWRSADVMWRLAGDTAADYNHYTKRATLGTLYAATLAVFASDHSEDKAETLAFLDRRIEGVMRFEKAKARIMGGTIARDHFSFVRFAGRLRYPAQ